MAACDEEVNFSWCIACKEQLASSVLHCEALVFNYPVPTALPCFPWPKLSLAWKGLRVECGAMGNQCAGRGCRTRATILASATFFFSSNSNRGRCFSSCSTSIKAKSSEAMARPAVSIAGGNSGFLCKMALQRVSAEGGSCLRFTSRKPIIASLVGSTSLTAV